MSIYLFKTEEHFGGDTRVFTEKEDAMAYLNAFLRETDRRITCRIEEYKPVLSSDYKLSFSIARSDGLEIKQNLCWFCSGIVSSSRPL